MGTSFTATHHYLNCGGSRLFTAWGHAPMGWGLPGAIGASIANKKKKGSLYNWRWRSPNEYSRVNAS